MLNEPHVSTANEEVECGTLRHINCVRVGYAGTFADGMCSNYSSIDKINTWL